ncbi:MAG TPA: tetratricopeptide repeat protein, partial [Chitinophagales bacterium]|nr:tetratricopeptide repeat protein [Chitinophagales bacterium]
VEVKVKELPPVETNQPEEKRPRIEEARPKAQEETTKGKYSFDEWLSILEQKKQNPDTAPVFDLPTPEVFNKKEIEDAKASGQAPVAPLKEASKTESGDEMVKQLASNSVSFKIDMATETLAKLYVKQGKNTEAINIYKKLMDKYPKKSSYFANQIENLK